MRALIVTADDFGLHERVNEAVIRAHREGVLACASLMVAAPAARDAVERARQCPSLRVGLHVVLADGMSTLGASRLPALTDETGWMRDAPLKDGLRYALLLHVRRQLAEEIRAQFDAFRATGLALDHVNTHKHLHVHPVVLSLILSIGREYGMRAMRLPSEASAPFWLKPWMALTRRRLARAGIAHNDYVVGMAQTGRLDEAAWLAALAGIDANDGRVGEIYCHPAVAGDTPITASMRDYRHADELDALLSPRVSQALAAARARGVALGGFSDVFGAGRA
jgi:hopanoid biosynthesis associated protein HpnK